MSQYRIMLADDHVLLRQGLRRIIEESSEMQVVGEAGDGLELISLLNKTVPDLVVLDISMPNMRGLEAVPEIKCRHEKVKVLILTMHRDKEYLYQALSSGADGYLLKEDADTELFSAIKNIREGNLYTSPSLAKDLVVFRKQKGHAAGDAECTDEGLTTREREVIKLIAEGNTAKDIAELLCISFRTVDHHRANIMQKLKLKKATDLIKYAMHHGYV